MNVEEGVSELGTGLGDAVGTVILYRAAPDAVLAVKYTCARTHTHIHIHTQS